MRHKNAIFILTLIFILIICINSQLFAQSVVLEETEVKEDDASVKMLFSTNRSIPVECYDLTVPPQIVVDFMGEIYTNKSEVIIVNKNVVKQMRIIKGTRKSQDLDDSFYAVDFIIVDLKEPTRYDFDRGLTTSVLIVSKPGKVIDKVAAKELEKVRTDTAEQKIQPEPVEERKIDLTVVSAPVSSVAKPSVSLQEKVSPVAESPTIQAKKTEYKPTSRRSRRRKRKSVGKGIKELLTFEHGRKKPAAAKTASTVGRRRRLAKAEKKAKVQPTVVEKAKERSPRRRGRIQAKKKDIPVSAAKEKPKSLRRRRLKTKEQKQPSVTVVKPKPQKISRRRKMRAKKTTALKPKAQRIAPSRRRRRGELATRKVAVSKLSEPERRLELAKQHVQEKKAQEEAVLEELNAAILEIANARKQKAEASESIKKASEKEKAAKSEFEKSIKVAELAKNAANSVWTEYSSAKGELRSLLSEGASDTVIFNAQQKYERKKIMLENAIKDAEEAKNETDAKRTAYETAQNEHDALLEKIATPDFKLKQAMADYGQLDKELAIAKKEHVAAQKELASAERAYKQYELEQADQEYKKSLMEIDSSLVQKIEEQERAEEQARLSELEEKRQEEERLARSRKIQKDKKRQTGQARRAKRLEERKRAKEQRLLEMEEESAIEQARLSARQKVAQEEKATEPEVVPQEKKSVTPRRRRMRKLAKKEEAVSGLSSSMTEILQSAVELRNAGLQMQRAGDLDSAVKYYRQALMSDPNYAAVHNDLGILYEQKGLDDKAKTEYLKTLKINPHYIKAHSNLALLYEKTGNNKKAYYHWKQRVQLGKQGDLWTEKARERMKALEQKR